MRSPESWETQGKATERTECGVPLAVYAAVGGLLLGRFMGPRRRHAVPRVKGGQRRIVATATRDRQQAFRVATTHPELNQIERPAIIDAEQSEECGYRLAINCSTGWCSEPGRQRKRLRHEYGKACFGNPHRGR